MTYKIVRFYKKSGRRKILRKGLTREEAQSYCSREDTERAGVWFDGFEREGE